jgi:hypothetical protein
VKLTLTKIQLNHLKKKPKFPSAIKCSAMEWSKFTKAFAIWEEEEVRLRIDALKPYLNLTDRSDLGRRVIW